MTDKEATLQAIQDQGLLAVIRGPSLALTVKMVEGIIRPSLRLVGFWKSASRQDVLRSDLFRFLVGDDEVLVGDHEGEEIFDLGRADAISERLMELAKANHDELVEEK